MNYKIGIGTDQHQFDHASNKAFVMAGVKIPDAKALKAHSDGDFVLHAIFNAISSAIGDRSIGYYFDDKDAKNEGMNSAIAIAFILQKAREKSLRVNNVAISIECKTPKIDPHVNEMKKNIAMLLGCSEHDVGITASTGEGLSAYGKGEGVFAQCAVSLIGETKQV
ncbi:MAG TPA: 2-C-methyl-D-erythritol 2,4-cyclodiphosphate synthase [Candidatus Norongarragalinales archaeon]|jgi:2-C-methyl-D-erythritol 2,4-cyclodiphosphate synthase|nr:2-C-methyl-D-erythritol 2,4-cyclodiphosphate synthase [Candidatus Norongarragalinales archaeon]